MSKQLSATCDFNGLLVCQLPKDILEVELKVKTKWGNHTLIEDYHSRMERYHPWNRADCRVRIHSRRRKMPHCAKSNDNNNDPKGNSMDSTYPQVKDLATPLSFL